MITRLLLAVDDSRAALAAARTAIDLAGSLQAQIRAVHVVRDHLLTAEVARVSRLPRPAERRGDAAVSVLGHVERLARRAGVEVGTTLLEGEPAACLLQEARSWPADLIVIGRSRRSGPGEQYVGGTTAQVLEFAEQPVLVVP